MDTKGYILIFQLYMIYLFIYFCCWLLLRKSTYTMKLSMCRMYVTTNKFFRINSTKPS